MGVAFSGGANIVMAAGAATDNLIVVHFQHRLPGDSVVARFAQATTVDVGIIFSVGINAVVTADTRLAVDAAVIKHRAPGFGAMTIVTAGKG